MDTYIITFLIVVSSIFLFILRRKFIYWLPVFLILGDISASFIEGDGLTLYFKSLILFIVFISVYFNSKHRKLFGAFTMLIYFLFVNILNINSYGSTKVSSYYFASIFLLPLGFISFRKLEELHLLLKGFYWMMIFYLINLILSTILNIGVDERRTQFFLIGDLYYLGGNTYIAFLLVLVPLIQSSLKSKKSIFLLFGMTIFFLMFLMFELKRMTLIVIILGYMIYFYYSSVQSKMKQLVWIGVVVLIAIIAQPYYLPKLNIRLAEREKKFQTNISENEARYIESVEFWNSIYSFKDPVTVFFGDGMSNYDYQSELLGERNIHIEYSMITKMGGLIGLVLYLYILIAPFVLLKRYFNRVPDKEKFRPYFVMARNLLFLFFLAGFSGGHIHITFRGMVFLFVGAVMGVLYNETRQYSQMQDPQHLNELSADNSEENKSESIRAF